MMPPPGLQSKHKLREHIILFPDHTFQDWQEDETPGWAALQYLMLKAADVFPWAGRLSQVFFRGSSKTGEGLLWAGAHARLAGAACSMTDAGAILCCTAHKLELSLQCCSRKLDPAASQAAGRGSCTAMAGQSLPLPAALPGHGSRRQAGAVPATNQLCGSLRRQ